jgi:hypothetical protein
MSVKDSAHLRATVLAVKAAPREVRQQVRAQTRAVAAPQWKQALASKARTEQHTRMLVNTARITVSDQSVRVRSAGAKRKVLSGGATPYRLGKAYEFGRRSRNATQLPRPNRRGYVFYPALADMAPRIISLWVQTAIRTVYDALEGKR